MKKVLVIGGAGLIGKQVISYLLMEGKYDITCLDLYNKRTTKILKKYNKRINIVYGNVLEKELVNSIIKDKDIIINLATVMPPLAALDDNISYYIEYVLNMTLEEAINNFNKDCFYIYTSTTSLYIEDSVNIDNKIKLNNLDNYSLNKYKSENLIIKNINNYLILRVPLVLGNINNEPFMFQVNKNKCIHVVTSKDAARAIVNSLKHLDKINNKVYNIGTDKILFRELLIKILENYGLCLKYLTLRLFLSKDYHSPVLEDTDILNDIIHYKEDTIDKYFTRLKTVGKKRVFKKILAMPIIWILKKGMNK